jgi:hypothetical protein
MRKAPKALNRSDYEFRIVQTHEAGSTQARPELAADLNTVWGNLKTPVTNKDAVLSLASRTKSTTASETLPLLIQKSRESHVVHGKIHLEPPARERSIPRSQQLVQQ